MLHALSTLLLIMTTVKTCSTKISKEICFLHRKGCQIDGKFVKKLDIEIIVQIIPMRKKIGLKMAHYILSQERMVWFSFGTGKFLHWHVNKNRTKGKPNHLSPVRLLFRLRSYILDHELRRVYTRILVQNLGPSPVTNMSQVLSN